MKAAKFPGRCHFYPSPPRQEEGFSLLYPYFFWAVAFTPCREENVIPCTGRTLANTLSGSSAASQITKAKMKILANVVPFCYT